MKISKLFNFLFLTKAVLAAVLHIALIGRFFLTVCFQASKMRIAVGSIGAQYCTTKESLIKSTESHESSNNVSIKETEGSLKALKLLSKNYLNAIWIQSDIINEVMQNPSKYQDISLDGLCVSFRLYKEAIHIFVKKDSSINSIANLRGKRVSVGTVESGVCQNALLAKLSTIKTSAYINNIKYLSEHVSLGFHEGAVEFSASKGISVQDPDGK
ncbi:MAG: hypothetical protein HUJ51_00450 [Eggerthellaceae bacterium]|nr:hypothetical protein [Eggerthellaceae bacterium]